MKVFYGQTRRWLGSLLTMLLGAAFFFIIIGVFGMPASLGGLGAFVVIAIAICRRPQEGRRQ